MRNKLNLKQYIPAAGLICLILVMWEVIVRAYHIEMWLLPAPSDIAKALWATRSQLIDHSIPTIVESMIGFVTAIVIGVAVGVVIHRFSLVRRAVYPLIIALQTVPPMALAPLLVVWFGYGLIPKVLLVILVTFYPVTVSTVGGLGSVDTQMVDLMRTMRASEKQIYLKVKIPAALPEIYSGIKVGATYTVISAIVGEWMGAGRGLGIYLIRSSNSFLTDRVFAGIITIAALSVLMFGLVELTQRIVMPWYYRRQEFRQGAPR